MALSLVLTAWLVGTLGGVHCLSMCGGFITAVASRTTPAGQPIALLPAATVARRQLAYHVARIASYALLGAAFGAAGAVAIDALPLASLQRALYIVANGFLLVLGVVILLRSPGLPWLQRAGGKAFAVLLHLARPLLRHPGLRGRIALGLIWGLVPCAMVYSVLPLAMFAGGAWQGAAVMVAFGAGTLPNLLLAGFMLERAKRWLDMRALRYSASALMIAFGLLGVWRVLDMPQSSAQGLICLVPMPQMRSAAIE